MLVVLTKQTRVQILLKEEDLQIGLAILVNLLLLSRAKVMLLLFTELTAELVYFSAW